MHQGIEHRASKERISSEEQLKRALVDVRSALIARLGVEDMGSALHKPITAALELEEMIKEYGSQNEHGKMFYHIEAAAQLRSILEGALQAEAERQKFPHAAAVLAQ